MCLTLTLCAALVACAPVPTEPGGDQDPVPYVPHPAPQMPTADVPQAAMPMEWWHDTTLSLSLYDSAKLDEIARHPVAAFQLRLLLSPEGSAAVAQLRARNPDIVILGIQEVLSAVDVWATPAHRARFPLSGALYDILNGHFARRTDGQVATMWTDAPMVNPWQANAPYNQALLRRYMDAICDAAMLYPTAIDGIFHDYTSPNPYVYPVPSDPSVQADLDGDGVGALTDPDDKAAWVAWQHALADEWQARFGPGLIQVANGRLPHSDAVFASKMAGIHYERFPTTPWGYSDLAGMDLMLGHLRPGYVTPRRGRVWSHIQTPHAGYQDLCRLTSMLAGVPYSFWNTDSTPLEDTLTVDCGQPLEPMTRTELSDGTVQFTRPFERGNVLIEMWSWGGTKQAAFLQN